MATSVPDIERLRLDFCSLILRAKGSTVAHFVAWLDLKVAEYKVYGHMILTNEENDNSAMWQDSMADPLSWPVSDQHQPEYGELGSDYDDQGDVAGAQSSYVPPPKKKKTKPSSSQSSENYDQSNTFPDSQTPAIAGDLSDTPASSAGSSSVGMSSPMLDIKPKIEMPDSFEHDDPMRQFETASSSSFPPAPMMPMQHTPRPVAMPSVRGRGVLRGRPAGMRGGARGALRGRGGIRMPSKSVQQVQRTVPVDPMGLPGGPPMLLDGIDSMGADGYKTCPHCGKRFDKELQLVWHLQSCAMSLTMETNLVFQCSICKKGFVKKNLLKQHQLTHMDLRFTPYKCRFCGKPFPRKFCVKRHEPKCSMNTASAPSTVSVIDDFGMHFASP